MTSTDATRVRECLTSLERIERYVVLMFYADDLTPAEIGVVLNVSLARVTRIIDAFRETVAKVLSIRETQRDAQKFVADWLESSPSAMV